MPRLLLSRYGCMNGTTATIPIVKNAAYRYVSALRRLTPGLSQIGPRRLSGLLGPAESVTEGP